MSACEALELRLNEIHEASCALYIRHKYNQAVVNAFVGDEYFGADRFVVLKERMGLAVRTFQKLSAAAKAAVGITGGPFSGKGKKKKQGRQRICWTTAKPTWRGPASGVRFSREEGGCWRAARW